MFHVYMAQESDTTSLVRAPKDGFDDDPAEENEIMSEGGLNVYSGQESEVDVLFRLPGALAVRRGFESLDGVNLMKTVLPS